MIAAVELPFVDHFATGQFTPVRTPCGLWIGICSPFFQTIDRGRVSHPHPMRRRWGNRWRRFCGTGRQGSARAKSRNLIVLILLHHQKIRVTGRRRFLHHFSILTALFNTIVRRVLLMTREHHSVIKMSLPRSQQRGLFLLPASGGYIKFSPFMFYYG